MVKTVTVKTRGRDDFVDITDHVAEAVAQSGVADGICVVFTPHTTAAVTINENADPDVQRDLVTGLNGLAFEKMKFLHGEGNSPAHLKSSLVGCSETVIVENGRPVLGTWQGIYLCEFDGPRTRKVCISVR